jgi:predicted GNAT family N-acyltransferase
MLITKVLNKLTKESRHIRQTVFVDEQGFNEEFDSIDRECVHLLCYQNDAAVGTCRIIYSDKYNSYMIGRVAVLKEYRKKGVGRKLMEAAEEYLKDKDIKYVLVSSQKRAIPFYKKIGYTPIGDFYLDEHYPHILMRKELF